MAREYLNLACITCQECGEDFQFVIEREETIVNEDGQEEVVTIIDVDLNETNTLIVNHLRNVHKKDV